MALESWVTQAATVWKISLRSFFSPFENDFVISNTSSMPISPLLPYQASILKQQQIESAAATSQILLCTHVLMTLCGVTLLSPHLWPCMPADSSLGRNEGHKLLSQSGKEIPGEQIGIVLITGKRQGRGAEQHSSNQATFSPREDEQFEVGLRWLKLSF